MQSISFPSTPYERVLYFLQAALCESREYSVLSVQEETCGECHLWTRRCRLRGMMHIKTKIQMKIIHTFFYPKNWVKNPHIDTVWYRVYALPMLWLNQYIWCLLSYCYTIVNSVNQWYTLVVLSKDCLRYHRWIVMRADRVMMKF